MSNVDSPTPGFKATREKKHIKGSLGSWVVDSLENTRPTNYHVILETAMGKHNDPTPTQKEPL